MTAKNHWFLELDLAADPEITPDDAFEMVRDWYDGTKGYVRIHDNVVEADTLGEVFELKLRLPEHVSNVRKMKV